MQTNPFYQMTKDELDKWIRQNPDRVMILEPDDPEWETKIKEIATR